MKQYLLYILFILPSLTWAQLGGSTIYEFVNTPTSARENALGGNVRTIHDGDVTLALKNPSLLDSTYSGAFSGTWGSLHITQTNIGFGSFAFAHTFDKITYMGGIHFMNYGRFSSYDEAGVFLGTFFASDYEIIFGASYEIVPKIYAGISIKPILSYYEIYSSYGLLSDIAVSYKDTARQLTTSLIIANAGLQLTNYTTNNKEPIPFSVDFGITKKLAHAPFRFTITYQGLQEFNLSYDQKLTQTNTLINEEDKAPKKFKTFSTSLFNHMHLSGEILLFKSLNFDIGYNFRRAHELSFGESKKGVGFSLGFNLNLSYFSLSYGWAKQHVTGGTNYFTFTTNVENLYNQFKK